MTRRTLLHWMIQFLGNTDALQERVVTVPYGVPLHLAPPRSADLTTLQPSIRFGNTAAPYSERCTGKTHMLYLATWHATVVRHGNVACCWYSTYSARRPSTLCTRMSWHYHESNPLLRTDNKPAAWNLFSTERYIVAIFSRFSYSRCTSAVLIH